MVGLVEALIGASGSLAHVIGGLAVASLAIHIKNTMFRSTFTLKNTIISPLLRVNSLA